MKVTCHWNEGMRFSAKAGEYSMDMDAKRPIGTETAPNPKELVLAGLCGCTAMDVAALMRKHKQTVESFEMVGDAKMTETHPMVFSGVHLTYELKGPIDREKLIEAVTLSQTKYCGVSKMLSQAAPIAYSVYLNGEKIHEGHTRFN